MNKQVVLAFIVGLVIGLIVGVAFMLIYRNATENFTAAKYAKAVEVNQKVGPMFNKNKENYRKFRDELTDGDAVLYDDLKKIKKRDGQLNPSNIVEVL
ncbi:hypothetical protein KDA11_06095 [Candidatus Saccharibacteria bacterium]|nr:hypothetical protein [Candidatus Saccharibacteria bacterium]